MIAAKATVPQAGRDRSKTEPAAPGAVDYVLLGLVAFAPALFAIATWDPVGDRSSFQESLRNFSTPIIAIELAVLVYALREGFEPLRQLAALPAWAKAALLILVAVGFGTALLVASLPILALIRTVVWIVHLLFGLGVAHLLASRWSSLKTSLWSLVAIGGCLYTLAVILLVLAVPDPAQFHWGRLGLATTNVRHVGYYALAGATAALGVAVVESRPGRYAGAIAAAAALLALAFWTGSRGSIAAIAMAFVAGAILLPAFRTHRALVATGSSFSLGALLSLMPPVPTSDYGMIRIFHFHAAQNLNDVSSGRIEIWQGTLRHIAERPLFGHGESQFRVIVPEALGSYNHPHNALLQMLFQWGVVGAACFGALGAVLVWRSTKRARRGSTQCAPAFLTLAGILSMSLLDGALYYPYPIMIAALCLAFLLTDERVPRQAG